MESIRVLQPITALKTPASSTVDINVPTPPRTPPTSSPRTISELITYHAKQNPNEPILGYPTDGTLYQEYTYRELETLSLSAAHKYGRMVSLRMCSSEPERVVALLGQSDFDYFIATLALSRLGFTVLFLSTRISEAAYVSLLNITNCNAILVGSAYKRLAQSLTATVEHLNVVDILDKAQYTSKKELSGAIREQKFDLDQETNSNCWIIHSSGSTGLPKPIYQTHHAAIHNYANNMNMRGFITLPLFHAHGLSSVFRAISSRKLIYMHSATLPMTKQNLLGIMQQHKDVLEIFYGVPYALKLLSETEEGIQCLSKMKIVMFGGSACPDTLGDQLTDGGVNLISHYGTTESGQLMTSVRPAGDRAWNYVRVHDALEPYIKFEARGGNLFELIVLEGWPSLVTTNRPGGYATKDLFEPHPSISGAWKYAGRLDDTIVLVNGEKAIPNSLEQAVRRQPIVREALVFGTGRSCLGLMVIPADGKSPEELVTLLWPTIAKENETMPSYAQISSDMVSVLPVGTHYPRTDKGTVIRQAFYRDFQREIDDVYTRLESNASGSLVLDQLEMQMFLRKHIMSIISDDYITLDDDTDLFSVGIDSLQTTKLRGILLQQLQFNGQAVPQNVVFENPTVAKLADELIRIRDKKAVQTRNIVEEMEALIQKYSILPQHCPSPSNITSVRCVIVTGATGSLGAHVVAQLAVCDDVDEIVCLVRAKSDESACTRTMLSLRERALLHSLSLSARRKITCVQSDLSKDNLGLRPTHYEELSYKVNTVIHCAWSVNFNKSLSSFEDCIAGAHNLLKFCSSVSQEKPASFNFCSSVSTVAATLEERIPEALPISLTYAQGMGYAQSKLITEHIVTRAAESGIQARVLRVGQIVADTIHGIWNDTEAIPLMLQSAVTMGALPALSESPRWLPVDIVATTVIDISFSSAPPSKTVYNVVNPRAFNWTRDLIPCLRSAGLEFEEVTAQEWVKRLRASNPDPIRNPTIKLVEFFARKYEKEVTRSKSMIYATSITEQVSPILKSTSELSQSLVTKFVQHFLNTTWRNPETLIPVNSSTRLIVVAGPCGTGKSTIATALADHYKCIMIEGDSVHDSIAITKMTNGIPLSGLDRQIWLSRLKTVILERIRADILVSSGTPTDKLSEKTIVVTCSALRREHRDSLRDMMNDKSITTTFVMLQADEEELVRRVSERKGHYMKQEMVASQIAVVEDPTWNEPDVLPMDTQNTSLARITDLVVSLLGK